MPPLSQEELLALEAAEKGDKDQLQSLLQDPDANIDFLNKALLISAKTGSTAILKELLQRKDLEVESLASENGNPTPFLAACKEGHVEIVKCLASDSRVDVNKGNEYGSTPLWAACRFGHLEIVKYLASDPRVDVNIEGNFKLSPFWSACERGHVGIVKHLAADPRVNVKKADRHGSSPFRTACREGHLEVVKYLAADPRVDVNKEDRDSSSPFWGACEGGHLEIVRYLASDPRVDVNKASKYGSSPFWVACSGGFLETYQISRLEIVKYLASDPRVDVNQVDKYGLSPFSIACEQGHLETVKYLASDPRIDINQANDRNETPFCIACRKGHLGIVKYLAFDSRVDVNQVDSSGRTPLSGACQRDQVQVVKYVISEPRVDINQGVFDPSPLWLACKKKDLELAQIILACPYTIDTKVSSQRHRTTAVQEASRKECHSIVGLIRAYQRNPSQTKLQLRRELGYAGSLSSSFFSLLFSSPLLSLFPFLFTLWVMNQHEKTKTKKDDIFALALLLADGYLQLKGKAVADPEIRAERFFAMIKSLPVEIIMLMVNQVYLSPKILVLSYQTEAALKRILSYPFF